MLAYKEMQDAVDGTALNGHQQSILAGVHQPRASKKWDCASNILDFCLKSFAFVSSSASGPRPFTSRSMPNLQEEFLTCRFSIFYSLGNELKFCMSLSHRC